MKYEIVCKKSLNGILLKVTWLDKKKKETKTKELLTSPKLVKIQSTNILVSSKNYMFLMTPFPGPNIGIRKTENIRSKTQTR